MFKEGCSCPLRLLRSNHPKVGFSSFLVITKKMQGEQLRRFVGVSPREVPYLLSCPFRILILRLFLNVRPVGWNSEILSDGTQKYCRMDYCPNMEILSDDKIGAAHCRRHLLIPGFVAFDFSRTVLFLLCVQVGVRSLGEFASSGERLRASDARALSWY